MKILVVNAGSSSLKYQLIDMNGEKVLAKGVCERIGQEMSVLIHKGKKEVSIEKAMPTHTTAVEMVLSALTNPEHGVVNSINEISAFGHRVLHSGEDFDSSVLITDDVLATIEKNVDLGPLHMPANIMGIKACREVMPFAPSVAVFDTTFHSTMPDYAYMYALPMEAYTKYKVRKYGFHGTSHMFVAGETARILGRTDTKVVICHLGNGASVSAVKDGKCVDTSMGLTPLEGLVMGTRSGDLDPAVLEYLMGKTGMDIGEMTNYLNKKSGVLGISGISSDFRDVTKAMAEGNKRAKLAVEMFCYRVRKYIGSYAAAMGGLDCISITAGIGENDSLIRGMILEGLEFLGVEIDENLNRNFERGIPFEISKKSSKVKVYIVPTNEELVIARETLRLSK